MRSIAHTLLLLVGGSLLGLGLNAASPRPVRLSLAVYPSSASGTAACVAPPVAPEPGGAKTFSWNQVPTVKLDEAVKACVACTAGFVDARGAAAFARGHITGAVHLPPVGHVDAGATMRALRKHETLIVLGEGSGCDLAAGVADRLVAEGFKDVRVLEGSWREWQAHGGPAESGMCQTCGLEGHALEGLHP